MNKANVFKSSSFYMSENDVLHMIILDETGTAVTIDLQGVDSETSVPGQPTVSAATDIATTSFTANWQFMENSTGYYLDVATDSAFTSMVAGYDNKNVSNVITTSVSGLTSRTDYFYRVRAYNNTGTSISSSTIAISTPQVDIIDQDGNAYTTIFYGGKEWMVENLKTEKYGDGSAIPEITDNTLWVNDVLGAHCYYNNDSITYKADYGTFYNWYVITNVHDIITGQFTEGGVGSVGWRIPTDTDWASLVTAAGGEGASGTAGASLKELGLTHWLAPNNLIATNSSGFSARGSGSRNEFGGAFNDINGYCGFWTSTAGVYPGEVVFYDLDSSNEHCFRNEYNKKFGFNIRCVRDV